MFCVAAVSLFLALSADAQSRFEVASVRPSEGSTRGSVARPEPGGERYVVKNATLATLITTAYRLRFDQVSGGPAWIRSDRYDIEAKAERPSTAGEFRAMLETLLAERFGLAFHRTRREAPVYLLSVDDGGPKLKPHLGAEGGIEIRQPKPFHMEWSASGAVMDDLAWRLADVLGRSVVNRTELTGGYDFELRYTAEPPTSLPPGALLNGEPLDLGGPRIFEALRKQLGLRLESGRAPVETIVVDSAERPAAN